MRADLFYVSVIHVTWCLESGLRAGGYINCVTPANSLQEAINRAYESLIEDGFSWDDYEEAYPLDSEDAIGRLNGDMLELMRQASESGEPRFSSLFSYPSDDVPDEREA